MGRTVSASLSFSVFACEYFVSGCVIIVPSKTYHITLVPQVLDFNGRHFLVTLWPHEQPVSPCIDHVLQRGFLVLKSQQSANTISMLRSFWHVLCAFHGIAPQPTFPRHQLLALWLPYITPICAFNHLAGHRTPCLPVGVGTGNALKSLNSGESPSSTVMCRLSLHLSSQLYTLPCHCTFAIFSPKHASASTVLCMSWPLAPPHFTFVLLMYKPPALSFTSPDQWSTCFITCSSGHNTSKQSSQSMTCSKIISPVQWPSLLLPTSRKRMSGDSSSEQLKTLARRQSLTRPGSSS